MADKDLQDLLGRTEKSPQILMRSNAPYDVSDPDPQNHVFTHEYYVSGGAEYPGRHRWVQTLSTNDDATKAAAIQATLAAG